MKSTTNLVLVVVFLALIDSSLGLDPVDPTEPDVAEETKNVTGTRLISLAESIMKSRVRFREQRAQTMQEYWKKTFEDIRNLAVNFPEAPTRGRSTLNQWKLLLDDDDASSTSRSTEGAETTKKATRKSRPRFEGFASWERQLQLWADEVSEYIEKRQIEAGEYPFSNYGRPLLDKNVTDETVQDEADIFAVDGLAKSEKIERPVPEPAKPGEPVVPHTDISDKSKKLLIVTTAALPWMTGTAVNPLLRAAYLINGRPEAGGSVTLMLPWLERRSDQEKVYGANRAFETQEEQEEYIRTWLRDTAGMKEASEELKITWYTAWVEPAENSVYAMGDITALISADDVDICILEEPEHLNWYREAGESWTIKFKHVVGIVHTNYFAYAQEQPAALIRAPGMRLLSSWMCRAHCHRLIKLSGTLGKFAPEKELVENVHGVRGKFLQIGEELKCTLLSRAGVDDPVFGPEADPSVYFIGKMLWSKGLSSLMELLKYAEESAGLKLKVDMYGGGPDKDAADKKAARLGLDMPFHGPIDHAELGGTHKIFINPSTSEVLCTTVAEALAMGKFVVVPSHPSNDFFAQFPNCLPYATKEEFVGNLYYALTHSPEPLSEEYSYALSWQAATERLEAAGCISVREAEAMERVHESPEAGVEIDLPPLIESEKQREQIAKTFRQSRRRYRLFREKLAKEIEDNKVLPSELQKRVVAELDKRLDLDIDTILESPKLRLQLSPAELDKRLLELYNKVSQGPSGDILRVIGGGTNVGRQNLYMKQQAQKQLKLQKGAGAIEPFPLPDFIDMEDVDEKERTTTQWVKMALRRNLPSKSTTFAPKKMERALQAKNDDSTKMSMKYPSFWEAGQPQAPMKTVRFGSRPMRPPRTTTSSLLI